MRLPLVRGMFIPRLYAIYLIWKRKTIRTMKSNMMVPSIQSHTGKARFLDACHHRQPDATPIWFMRQAGRCIAEYRELRKRYDILTMAKTPELCAQVTLMPVKKFGVDGAV